MAAGRIRLLRDGFGRAVESHRHHDDHDPCEDRESRVRVQSARHDVSEPLAADQPGDHDHGEREQDRLVDAEQQRPPCQRQLHLLQNLALGRSHRLRGLDRVRRHTTDPERGDANRRRDGVDHRGDHGRAWPDGEEEHDRHEVGERRDDLHGVEHRADGAVEALGPARHDSERDADDERQGDGRQHQRKRLHALEPEPAQGERGECGGGPDRSLQPTETQGDEHAHDCCADPRHPAEQPRQPPHEVVEERGEVVERLDDHARVVGVPLVDEPRLEVVEVGRQLRPDETTRVRVLALQPRSSRRASRPGSRR